MRVWLSGSVRGASLTLLCLLFVLSPLFAGPGPVNTRGGGDSPFLLIRLEQLVSGLRAGAFPVRWMPDAAYGLGYPFFNFYAALPYYIAAVFRFLGWGPILSLQVTQALGFVLAAASMALFARRVLSNRAAVALAVVAYTCAPFHLVNVYVRGDSLSEFYAFAFYPLVFWALSRLHDHPSAQGAAWLALSLGGLVLTHNLSAAIFGPFAVGWAALLLWRRCSGEPEPGAGQQKGERARRCARRLWSSARWMLAGAVLALALSACLWLTVLDDLGEVWMGIVDIQTGGFFHYSSSFRGLGWADGDSLIQPRLLFDYDVTQASTPFAMGAAQAGLIALAVIAWLVGVARRDSGVGDRSSGRLTFAVGGLILSTLMIMPISRAAWAGVPVLPVVQFPWRFLSVQAFFGALLIGGLASRLPKPWLVASIGAGLLTLSAVGNLHPEYLPIDEVDVTPENLALFESFTTNVGTTIRGEYLPAIVEPRPLASAVTLHRDRSPSPIVLEGEIVQATVVRQDARSARWQVVVASDQAHLAFHTLFFPGWRASVDRRRVAIEPLPNTGLVSIRVPRGAHTVDLRFGRTPTRWVADGLSLAASLVIAVLLWPVVRRACDERRLRWKHVSTAVIGSVALLGVLVLVGGMLSVPFTSSSADLSMDFDRMPFLHHNPGGIDFGGRVRLAEYGFGDTVHGGDTLTVTLKWSRQDPVLTAHLWLVSPADVHSELRPPPPPLARSGLHIEGPVTRHALPVPADAPSGPYYLSLRVFDEQREVKALSRRGDTMGTTYLRPVWVDNPRPAQGDDPILARLGDRILLRDDVEVETDGTHWDIKLTWQATMPVAVNYTCSVRMLGADGRLLPGAQRDFAEGPGYGFWPTSAWPIGEWLTDRLRIRVPPGVRAEDAAALSVVLYDRSQPGFPAAGSVIVPLAEREHRYDRPPMTHPVDATLGGQVRMLGYDLDQDAGAVQLTVYWQAARRMSTDYTVFVHLFDPATETIASQSDVGPLNGTYPTGWWREGEVVVDEITLSLVDVPAGSYRLAVGMFDAQNGVRLPITVGGGDALPSERLVLTEEVDVRGD